MENNANNSFTENITEFHQQSKENRDSSTVCTDDSPTLSSGENVKSIDNKNDPKRVLFVPENFRSIIGDFVNDLSCTFPEYSFLWEKWGPSHLLEEQETIELFEYVLKIFPERFFDILYQNDEIFNIDSEINTLFLPNVEFKVIFNCNGISETTKKVIWKYLQLILFSILNSINDKSRFGESINIFDGLDENILQEKLEETVKGMSDFFTNINNLSSTSNFASNLSSSTDENSSERDDENIDDTEENINQPNTSGESKDESSPNMSFDFENNLPNPEELHEHLKTLFDGKIGKLAKELAEEITEDINQFIDKDDLEKVKTSQDVIKTLLKNPKKMMDLVKNVGKKLNTKMESGEISQDEIMKEAGDLFSKMKDMKGTKQFNEMFKNMANQLGMNGNGMKPDTNAMEQKMKNMQLKEKLKKRLQTKKENSSSHFPSQSMANGSSSTNLPEESTNIHNDLFSSSNGDFIKNPFQEIENIMKNLGLSDLNDDLNTSSTTRCSDEKINKDGNTSSKNKKKNKKR